MNILRWGGGYGMINFGFKSYELLGNVGSDFFHFLSATPEDILPFDYNFLMLIGIDALSLLISFVFLRMNFGINLFQISLTTCLTHNHFFSDAGLLFPAEGVWVCLGKPAESYPGQSVLHHCYWLCY